jgi:YjbE family integral membrane protein
MIRPDPRLFVDSLAIVLIDLLLAGDNALVIAMAVRGLSGPQRRIGILVGAGAAVILRIGITIAAAQLLSIEFIKLMGGAFVIWIAVKVLSDASAAQPATVAPQHFLRAIGLIVFADITMSTDNVLAVAGASRGSVPLIVFGLCVSIPFVVLSSNLLAVLMDRYSWIVYVGGAILGKVGGEMIFTDPVVARNLHPSETIQYLGEATAVAGILIAGRLLSRSGREVVGAS